MEPAAAAAGDSPPTACAPPAEHPAHNAQLAAKLAAGAHALCSMAEAAAAAAAEQQSEGDTFDHQRTPSGEQEAEGRPEPDSGTDGGTRACSQCAQTRTTTWRRHPLSRDWACNSCECLWVHSQPGSLFNSHACTFALNTTLNNALSPPPSPPPPTDLQATTRPPAS